LNICIGGDLDGQTVDLDQASFKAKDVEEGKSSEYRRQTYRIDDDLFRFWFASDLKFAEASQRAGLILRKPKN
jgi:hypothetical protein